MLCVTSFSSKWTAHLWVPQEADSESWAHGKLTRDVLGKGLDLAVGEAQLEHQEKLQQWPRGQLSRWMTLQNSPELRQESWVFLTLYPSGKQHDLGEVTLLSAEAIRGLLTAESWPPSCSWEGKKPFIPYSFWRWKGRGGGKINQCYCPSRCYTEIQK